MANDKGAVFETYDVFLSFTGQDTRHEFTGHLYDALCKEGIKTFMDDEELRVGEEIGPALLKAIEESQISIVVFSPNYAASSWCLDEFAKIVQCHKENNQIIFPIFYKVEPSDVRHQKNSYAEAMAQQETRYGEDSEKVRKWRSSLNEVSNLKGYHLKEGIEYEYKLIKEIVQETSIKVSPKSLDINERIVGLGHRVEELKSILEIESKDTTCFLGIHGSGGIGKTTLAKALYNSICDQFENACFLFNVRETSKQFEGKKLLLKMLLSDIFKGREIHFASVSEGTKTMKRMLGRKRVLLVLDDVDDIEQLKLLAGGRDWFGFGSKIIITTRDTHLLDAHQVEKKHEMKVLNKGDSMELFCQNAFKRSHIPDPNYEELSNRVINYAKGLPLALKVLGSHLITKGLDEWKSALDKYEKSPHKDIQSILRISYDSLDSNERDIFLDVACFFKGKILEYVKPILDACDDFHPEDGIRVLVDKSLITVENSCLMMHDLIQDMGREIVKEEKPKEVGKRSRLWFYKDVLEVLTEDTGSSKIEGIMLDPPQREEIEWVHSAFEKMKKLRILIVRNTSFSSAPSFLSNKLRLLDWKDYPSQSFPSGFCPKKIVAFNLRGSSLIQPFQAFEQLTYMNVSDCESITQIPNMSGAKSLRELRFDRCEKLDTVDESVGFLPKLVYLNASECSQLRSFVPKIYLPSLEHLSFSLCRSLQNFPEIVKKMYKPLKIYLINTSITELPHSIGNLIGLEYVEMSYCDRLQYLPSSLFMLPNLVTLKVGGCSLLNPESFRRLEVSNSLRTLHYKNVGLLDENLHMIIHSFPNLEDLNLSGNHFVSFPARIQESICLTSLDVSGCLKLEEIPELPPSVQQVNARQCNSLNAETLAMLWFQVRKEMKKFEVIMPKSEIPEWFDHRNEGGIPVFKARGKFPVVAVALVFEPKGVPTEYQGVFLQLIIEGEYVDCKDLCAFYVDSNHVLLFDVRVMLSDKQWESLDARLNNNDWKTVHVAFDSMGLTLRSWGVYVYKKETNMDDILFTTTTPYDHHPRLFFETIENDMTRLHCFNCPQVFDRELELLRYLEEMTDSDKVAQRDQSVIASLTKMSRMFVALREARGSGFILQEEDENEEDNIQRLMVETWVKFLKEKGLKEMEINVDFLLQLIAEQVEKFVKKGGEEDFALHYFAMVMLEDCEEGDSQFQRIVVQSILKRYINTSNRDMAKMLRRIAVPVQEEGNGTLFNLEDDDDKEGDSLLNGIAEKILMHVMVKTGEEEDKEGDFIQRLIGETIVNFRKEQEEKEKETIVDYWLQLIAEAVDKLVKEGTEEDFALQCLAKFMLKHCEEGNSLFQQIVESILKRYNHKWNTDLAKMVRRAAIPVQEEGNIKLLKLEDDDDDKEGDSLLNGIAEAISKLIREKKIEEEEREEGACQSNYVPEYDGEIINVSSMIQVNNNRRYCSIM